MSGGVDSSVAAAVLRDEGHEVVGCTLRLWGGESDSGCCSAADVDDARRVAQVLGIDHHVFNLAEEFDAQVVDPYVAAHASGTTPNPCVECNRSIKFGALLARAERLGFETVATGHHARVTATRAGFELRRGHDVAKDQSYVLGFLTSGVLARVLLPIGTMTKAEVRERAHALGLRTAAKPDSQEVCFIPRGRRGGFLASRATLTPAAVVDRGTGANLGTVPAIELVTVGQRRGIGHGPDGQPRFVADVDVTTATVLVGRRDDIAVTELDVDRGSVTWARGALDDGAPVLVQTSAHGTPALATMRLAASARLELEAPTRPVAAGQLAVLYAAGDPELVLGSATVARRVPALA
jgi:tRNA-specific 2-thiouridylase